MARAGIGDSELARRIPVSRPTLIRWREGVTARPRYREDVSRCAEILRLTPEETDAFLSAAGFAPNAENFVRESESVDGWDSSAKESESVGGGISVKESESVGGEDSSVKASGLESGEVSAAARESADGENPARAAASPSRRVGFWAAVLAVAAALVAVMAAVAAASWASSEREDMAAASPVSEDVAAATASPVSEDAAATASPVSEDAATATASPVSEDAATASPEREDTAAATASPEGEDAAMAAAAYPVAADGETLIVIAPFVNYTAGGQGFNVTGRLMAALDGELAAAGLADARTAEWHREIASDDEARAAAERSRAALLIWGEYDSGRALARFESAAGAAQARGGQVVDIASSPSELPAVINVGLTEETRRTALAALGGLYLERGEYDRAKSALARALTPKPSDAAALANLRFLLGRAYQGGDLADHDEAIWLFTQALEAAPRSAETLNARAVSYLDRGRDGDAERAVSDLARAAAIAPERAGTLVNLGVAYARRGADGDTDEALEALTKALELDPDSAAALVNRAASYIGRGEAGDVRRAMDDLERAIALDGGMAAAYLNRGAALIARGGDGDGERAMADFSRALELDPDSAAAAFSRALLRSENGDVAGSLSDLRRARSLEPRRAEFAVTLCWQLSAARMADEALAHCAEAAAADGKARDAMGLANALLGRRTRAAEHFEAFLVWAAAEGDDCRAAHEDSRRRWIEALRAGEDPFDDETLRALRVRPAKPGSAPC